MEMREGFIKMGKMYGYSRWEKSMMQKRRADGVISFINDRV